MAYHFTSRYTKPNCAQLFNTRSTNGTFCFYSSLYCSLAQKECLFLGLESNFAKGFLVAIISVLPLYIVFPIIGTINPDLTFSLLVRKSLLPGFIEELLCRAFMFGLFFRYAKIGFFWATLFPAALFGLAHTYQGHDMISSLAAFGVTFIGAVYFSWMYAEWELQSLGSNRITYFDESRMVYFYYGGYGECCRRSDF